MTQNDQGILDIVKDWVRDKVGFMQEDLHQRVWYLVALENYQENKQRDSIKWNVLTTSIIGRVHYTNCKETSPG